MKVRKGGGEEGGRTNQERDSLVMRKLKERGWRLSGPTYVDRFWGRGGRKKKD